jgi:hypothetical protein
MKDLILSLSPGPWKEYELIDTGGFEKLERFGKFILSRPEPQAIWDKSLPEAEWKKLAHAHFAKEKNNPEKVVQIYFLKFPGGISIYLLEVKRIHCFFCIFEYFKNTGKLSYLH